MKKHDICSSIISLEDEVDVLKKEHMTGVPAKLRLSAIKANKVELKKLYSQLAKISKLEQQFI